MEADAQISSSRHGTFAPGASISSTGSTRRSMGGTPARPGWNSSTKPIAKVSLNGAGNAAGPAAPSPSSLPVATPTRKLSLGAQPATSNSRLSFGGVPQTSAAPSIIRNAPTSATQRTIPLRPTVPKQTPQQSTTVPFTPAPTSLSSRKQIPPAAERTAQTPSRQSLRSTSENIPNPSPSTTINTVTQIMAGVTSKGTGRSDLNDQYQVLLTSKNPSERSMRANLRTLRHLILTQGIPHSPTPLPPQDLRCRIWKLLLGVYKTSADEYVALVSKGPSPVFDKIKNDAFRTLMGDKGFGKVVEEGMLVRVLNAFAWRAKDYPTSRLINLQFSYVQGMNVLAAPFLYIMPELDAFYTFATFIHHTCPLYVQPALEGVHCGIKLLDKCLLIADPTLHAYLKSKNLDPVMYAFPSVMTFSACTPPLHEVLRLWDFLLSYGVHMNIVCIVAQLVLIRSEILKSASPMKVLRTFPKLDAKKVIGTCMKLIELIPDSLYDLLVRHVFDAMVCDGILNEAD